MRGGASASSFAGILVVILVIIGLYYIYRWLKGVSTVMISIPLLTRAAAMTLTGTDANTGSGQDAAGIISLKGVQDGGAYTVNLWVYITDTKGFLSPGTSTPLAHLMEISNNRFAKTAPGKTLIFVGLNPVNAALVIRQSTMDPNESINNSLTAPNANGAYPLNDLITNYNTGANYKSNDRCDIINGIEYQRWVMVSAVGNNRTLDIYVDGKLARSCIYSSGNSLGSSDGTAQAYFGLNNKKNLKGYFGVSNFYNYALTPDAIWRAYQDGPSGPFDLFKWITNLFSGSSLVINGNNLNQINPCMACQGS
jgi:hypothetical protein